MGVQRCGLHRPKLHGLPQGPEKQPVLQDLCRKRCTKMHQDGRDLLMCHRHFGILIYFDCAKVTILVSSQVWYKNTNDPTKKTCETTAVPQASDWNPMIKIIEHSVSGAICTVWSCILTAIARPQAPLSHPARAKGRVFTAGLIPITLYRFVFADFLLLSKSCHHVSAHPFTVSSKARATAELWTEHERLRQTVLQTYVMALRPRLLSRSKKTCSHGAKQTGI